MKQIVKMVFTLVLLQGLTGCAVYSLVQPGSVEVGEFRVESPGQWAQFKSKDIVYWTKDGLLLNYIAIATIKEDEHILKATLNPANQGFKYAKDLSIGEIEEMLVDALAAVGNLNVELVATQARVVDGFDASILDIKFDNAEGLTNLARVLLIQRKNRINVIYCQAPLEHYFPTFENEFDQVIDSARVNS